MSNEQNQQFPKDLLYNLYIEQNLSVREIADQLNISTNKVEYLICQKHKIRKPKSLIRTNVERNRYRSNKWNISKEFLEELYLDKNLNQKEIANQLNVKRSVVKSLLASYKITKSSELISQKTRKFSISKQEFETLYIEKNLSVNQMCTLLGCSTHTINKLANQYSVHKTKELRANNLSKGLKGRTSPMKGKKFNEEHKYKISEKLKGNKNGAGKTMPLHVKEVLRKALTGRPVSKKSIQKCMETKRKNGTFNTSAPEKQILKRLCDKFENVKYQYKSAEYPFQCDFYIPQLNLYIEYQGMWVHGFRPYDENNSQCLEQLSKWKQKSDSSSFYKGAIRTWTKRDTLKRRTAKTNNLNWIEFFSMKEFDEWYSNQQETARK